MESTDAISAFLYFVTIVTSLGGAGQVAELCAEPGVKCPARTNAFMAFGFLTAFIAIPLLVASVLRLSIIQRFEMFVSPVVVLFAIIACAVGSSPKTGISLDSALPPLLVWYGLITASAAMFLGFKNSGNFAPSKEKFADPNPVSVPMTGSVGSSIQMQPMQHTPTVPTQPAMPYTVPTSPNVNIGS